MASAADLSASELGHGQGDLRRTGALSLVPEQPGVAASPDRGDLESTIELSGTPLGYVLTSEPPSGTYVRARYADHHTAGYIFHRDDTEGHPASRLNKREAQVWWFHERSEWISWAQVLTFVESQPQELVLEPLFPPPSMPGCAPHGMHGQDHCEIPNIGR